MRTKNLPNQKDTVDFVAVNSGSIRFTEAKHSDGIYPAGMKVDTAIINEIFPWSDGVLSIVEVTGADLKLIFEHSVNGLPITSGSGSGWFLQVSKEIQVEYDLTKTAEIIDNVAKPPVIKTPGNRVVSIKVNGVEVQPTSKYKIVVPTWISEGEDGFVAFLSVPADKKQMLYSCPDKKCPMNREALQAYLKKHTPVTPTVEGRIKFKLP